MNQALAVAALLLAACSSLLQSSTSGPTSVDPTATGAGASGGPTASGDLVVPDLIGKTPEEAAELVARAGFSSAMEQSRPVECHDAPQIEGKINCQDPAAGATVKPYTVVQVNVYRPTRIAGAIVRSQLVALIGMTPEAAKAALASYGHDGYVVVEPTPEDDPDCGVGVVCGFDRPDSGIGIHDAITLYVNPAD